MENLILSERKIYSLQRLVSAEEPKIKDFD
jgi:hypothetical protein